MCALSTRPADPFIPLLGWFVIESHCATAPSEVLRLFQNPALLVGAFGSITLVPRLMRRFAASGTCQELSACATLFSLAPPKRSRGADDGL